MARETKIGIALMALLLGVFGFVAYKKWDGLKSAVASKGDAASQTGPPAGKVDGVATKTVEPPGNPFAAAEPASGAPVEQAEPTGDPFADPVSSRARVPVRPVSATATDEWSDPSPAGEGAAVAQQEPSVTGSETAPFGQGEPVAAEPAASRHPAGASADTVVDADPFGDAASESVSGAAEPMPSEDPFANSGEAGAAAVADDGRPVGATGETDAAASSAEAESDGDPFADASAAPVASADVSPADDAAPVPQSAGDPFGGEHGLSEAPAADDSASEFAGASELAASPATDEPLPSSETEPASAAADLAGIEPESATLDEAFESAPVAEEPSISGQTEYCVVAENDTYWSISQRVYGTPIFFQALAKYNEGRIQDPKRLRPGMKVLTPPASELTTRFPKLVSGRGAAHGSGGVADDAGAAGFLLDEDRHPAYRVGEGDTLGKIAQTHLGRASRWVQIYNLNRAVIPDAKVLKPGTVLKLPADASRVRLVPEG